MPAAQPETYGLIGLGAVGTSLALCLAEHGYTLLVADARPRSTFEALLRQGKGKLRWVTAEELCTRCSVVMTSLPSVAVIAKVAEGVILPRLRGGSATSPTPTWIDLSTTDEAEVKRLGPVAKAAGIDLLEAPLTGGVHLVRSGDMTVLVGGDAAALARQSALLHTLGGKVIHCGGWGSASVVKVISNMLAALHLVGVGEALVCRRAAAALAPPCARPRAEAVPAARQMLGKKSGVALPQLWDALKASAGNSYVLETEGPFIMNGTFDTDFALKLHCKDLDIGYRMARQLKSPLVLHSVYERARARYGDDAPSSLPAKLMEEDCGEALQAPGFDGFTYQDRTSNWDRPLKGGSWTPRSKL